MVAAVELVRQGLVRAVDALGVAGVEFAIVGGNAVAAWVATVDAAAVRNTQDVNVLIRRADLPAARAAPERAGFAYRHVGGLEVFLDGAAGNPRDGVHIVFAGEIVRPGEAHANPGVEDAIDLGPLRVISLEALGARAPAGRAG